jgi:hypothetical protein
MRRGIEREFRRLEFPLEQIAAAETERDAAVAAPADADANAEKVVSGTDPGLMYLSAEGASCASSRPGSRHYRPLIAGSGPLLFLSVQPRPAWPMTHAFPSETA